VLQSVDHVAIAVRDLESGSAKLGAILGRRPTWWGLPADGAANALFRLSNLYVELVAPHGAGALGDALRARLERAGEGLLGLAFGTDDAEICASALRGRGIAAADPVESEGRERDGERRTRWRIVSLPESQTRGITLFCVEALEGLDALAPAAPVADEKACAVGLDHVVVQTADADATIGLYRDRLGLRLALDRTFPERGVRLVFFRLGGVTIEIAARAGAPPDADAPDRLWGLAWQVGDADAARARLVKLGLDVTDVRSGNKPGTRVCTVRGEPLGVPTLLISLG
jgi:catechol 2,3-dioxygenase-like lactoylglutathione lyase family enzyme